MYSKADLVADLTEKTGIPKKQAAQAVDAVVQSLSEALGREGGARLADLGTFSVGIRKARVSRNPKTGEPVDVPEKRVVKFRAAKSLQEVI